MWVQQTVRERKKSELRETNFDCFCQGAQCPPELWWNYPYICPHTSRAPATSWHFPLVIKPAYKVYQSAFHPVAVYCSCKQQYQNISWCFCQSLWCYNLFCKYRCAASRLVTLMTRHVHQLALSCDGERACTGIYRVGLLLMKPHNWKISRLWWIQIWGADVEFHVLFNLLIYLFICLFSIVFSYFITQLFILLLCNIDFENCNLNI